MMKKLSNTEFYSIKSELEQCINIKNIENFNEKLSKLLRYTSLSHSIIYCRQEHVNIINEFADNLTFKPNLKFNNVPEYFIKSLLLYKIRPTNPTGVEYLKALKKEEIKEILYNFYTLFPMMKSNIKRTLLPDMERFYHALYLTQLVYFSGADLYPTASHKLLYIIKRYLKRNNIKHCENLLIKTTKLAYEVINKKECKTPLDFVTMPIRYVYLLNLSTLFNINELPDKYKKVLMQKMLSI